jgi:hypothetical protein
MARRLKATFVLGRPILVNRRRVGVIAKAVEHWCPYWVNHFGTWQCYEPGYKIGMRPPKLIEPMKLVEC